MRMNHSMTLATLAFLLPAALAAQTDGHQLTDRMIRRAETTVRQIALTRWRSHTAISCAFWPSPSAPSKQA